MTNTEEFDFKLAKKRIGTSFFFLMAQSSDKRETESLLHYFKRLGQDKFVKRSFIDNHSNHLKMGEVSEEDKKKYLKMAFYFGIRFSYEGILDSKDMQTYFSEESHKTWFESPLAFQSQFDLCLCPPKPLNQKDIPFPALFLAQQKEKNFSRYDLQKFVNASFKDFLNVCQYFYEQEYNMKNIVDDEEDEILGQLQVALMQLKKKDESLGFDDTSNDRHQEADENGKDNEDEHDGDQDADVPLLDTSTLPQTQVSFDGRGSQKVGEATKRNDSGRPSGSHRRNASPVLGGTKRGHDKDKLEGEEGKVKKRQRT